MKQGFVLFLLCSCRIRKGMYAVGDRMNYLNGKIQRWLKGCNLNVHATKNRLHTNDYGMSHNSRFKNKK